MLVKGLCCLWELTLLTIKGIDFYSVQLPDLVPYGAAQALCQHEGNERSAFGGELKTFPINGLSYYE